MLIIASDLFLDELNHAIDKMMENDKLLCQILKINSIDELNMLKEVAAKLTEHIRAKVNRGCSITQDAGISSHRAIKDKQNLPQT